MIINEELDLSDYDTSSYLEIYLQGGHTGEVKLVINAKRNFMQYINMENKNVEVQDDK
jgi:hypothetical protein